MAKRCTKCGAFLLDADRFCPSCGENAPQEVERQQPAPQQNYSNGAYNHAAPPPMPVTPAATTQNYYQPNQAQNYYGSSEDMTVGKWAGTIFVTNFLGFISWIFLFVWGFGSGPKQRKNYCKAMLIIKAVSTVLSIIMFAAYASFLMPIIEEMIENGTMSI